MQRKRLSYHFGFLVGRCSQGMLGIPVRVLLDLDSELRCGGAGSCRDITEKVFDHTTMHHLHNSMISATSKVIDQLERSS